MTLEGKTIVLGVTGGIAAYKACDLVRRLREEGATVKVIMSEAATRFITPLTMRTLSEQPVVASLFDEGASHPIYHISLAAEADVILVAPATANVIAKMAGGLADDALTTTLLAARGPIVVAPAMNERMYLNPVTQRNLQGLKERGLVLVGPGRGKLAEGEGWGRLAETDEIIAAVQDAVIGAADLAGRRVVVTAGGTREAVDDVRYVGNHSSGKMGYALAAEAAKRGADVTLISAPTCLTAPAGVERVEASSAAEMERQVLKRFSRADAVLMAAAVADFKPVRVPGKMKKGGTPASLRLEKTPDILAGLGRRKRRQVLCGFAAETERLEANAKAKLKEKHLDMIVANNVSRSAVFGSDYSRAVIIDRTGGRQSTGRISKRALAGLVIDTLKKFW